MLPSQLQSVLFGHISITHPFYFRVTNYQKSRTYQHIHVDPNVLTHIFAIYQMEDKDLLGTLSHKFFPAAIFAMFLFAFAVGQ